jgi:selenocysteine-specific elongation factor
MMHPVTVGTAGHIDHGKSALVRALTGTDPDRLAEEQRRGMTLDLGFAHLDLPRGRRIGIVDVPGHEALIHNMLAGAGGLDLVMLVVAADEGTMPQTREHLDILRFLSVAGGAIVLNKIDLVTDPEWLAAVEEELREATLGTPLEDAPLLRVSARTGQGLPGLVAALDGLVQNVPARPADGPVRLPVDRSFTMQGFGTVVTGTLWSGTLRTAGVLHLLPAGREVRVRGLQVHGASASEVAAGSRVAVNLAGIDKNDIRRGDVLITPGAFKPTERLDVALRLLPGAPPLKHGAPVHVHLGAASVVGRVILPDRPVLDPGDEATARLRLDGPLVAVHGDRFVVRRYSPTGTLGGGVVLNAAPVRRGRRELGLRQDHRQPDGPAALVTAAVAARGQAGLQASAVAAAAGLDGQTAMGAMAAARRAGQLVERADRLFAQTVIDAERARVTDTVRRYHDQAPWRRGIPREEVKSRLAVGAQNRLFDGVLADLIAEGEIREHGGLLSAAGFDPRVSEVDQRARTAVLSAIRRGGTSPPSLDDLREAMPADAVDRALQALADDAMIVVVSPDLRFAAEVIERIRVAAVETLRGGGELTVATLRDRLQTSRKYALALLEFFDTARITRRVGDRRVLGPRADTPPWGAA